MVSPWTFAGCGEATGCTCRLARLSAADPLIHCAYYRFELLRRLDFIWVGLRSRLLSPNSIIAGMVG
jgi:hypothetical protein